MIDLSDHDTHVYSPEDSDTHPWGDWQTKVATVAMIAALIGALAVLS